MSKRGVSILATVVVLLVGAAAETGQSSPAGRITLIRLAASPANYTGNCPATIHFNGFIRADGPLSGGGSFWRSDGSHGEFTPYKLIRAGQVGIHDTWRLGRPGENFNGWVQFGTGNTRSNRAEFHLHCRR